MGVYVADLFRLYPAVRQGQPHTGCAARAARCGGGNVVGIAVCAVTHDFGINFSAARLCRAQFLQQQHAAALPHHKAAAPGIKGN